ncbi:HAMP domain-containing histidine kinase [Acidicapsa dinghuensis]|uniref:histidine kinase n=1 Tax=Acidicapsa dinghuensis TaxID=2218256 RepID=A0ABW1EGH1_9BACT|nr:HAMP domain-containing histidine kinase [Acidicapsa dinghuensis]
MSPDTKRGPRSEDEIAQIQTRAGEKQGFSTYALLVISMALVIAFVTGVSLLLIRHHLREQVSSNLSRDLDQSVIAFQNLQAERLGALARENALIAELPTLKALMTSGDDLTIQDGAAEFWQLSGTDLFMLADPSGRVVAAYVKGAPADNTLREGMKRLLASPRMQYLIDGESLYACALRPLYFGSDRDGTLLGYVLSGISIERTVPQISQPTGVEATFLSGHQILASTLATKLQVGLVQQSGSLSVMPQAPVAVKLGDSRFLATTKDLSATATDPLQLVVLKSLEPAEQWINRIDRMVLVIGILALLSGMALMAAISRLVTRPLEELSRSVRAFGLGDVKHQVPRHGTQEVRQLSIAFASMRSEIQTANQTILESERLATIGRMASSVSHDLRHYLAAIFANAEFLASDRLSNKERAEIFADIRAAVNGTADMIESLLIFSRTGANIQRQPKLMATLVEQVVNLIRSHPDAEGVMLTASYGNPAETMAVVDCKQIERAVFNLLLNACQAAILSAQASVHVAMKTEEQRILVCVTDNGPGVPENIRMSLFEPFVSEGKQKGTGLGLTLANCIAVEHGGDVVLLSSRPGETIFQLTVARVLSLQDTALLPEAGIHDQVISDGNIRI